MQGFLIKHLKELVQTPHRFVSSCALCWWTGVGNNQLVAGFILKCYKHGTGKTLKASKPNSFPHNCTLPDYYMGILAP